MSSEAPAWRHNCLCCGFFIGAALIGGSIGAYSQSYPNAELPTYYSLDTCENTAKSGGSSGYKAYDLRIPTASDLPDTACPVSYSTPSGYVNISMEGDDGYRFGAKYVPVILVPTASYVEISFMVNDGNTGKKSLPLHAYKLGPTQTYPAGMASRLRRLLSFDPRGVGEGGVKDEDHTVASPGGRRLLKGSSRGSSSSSAFSSGRGFTTGSSTRWRSGSPTYASASYGYGGGAYRYGYAPRAYYPMMPLMIVGRSHYGCYSCVHRCSSCGCGSRTGCGHQTSATLSTSYDRYEVETSFSTPDNMDSTPLQLRVYNMTLYVPDTSTFSASKSVYVSFYTEDGDALITTTIVLMVFGIVIVFVTSCMLCHWNGQRAKARRVASFKQYGGGGGYPLGGYGGGYGVQSSLPMAQPAALPVAMPVATPVAQAGSLPVALPSSYPPSPPSSPPVDGSDGGVARGKCE